MGIRVREPVVVIEVGEDEQVGAAMKRQDAALVEFILKMTFPIHAVTLGSNGGYLIMCFSAAGKEGECLAEYEPPSGFRLPVHALLVDANGRTARAIVRERSIDRASSTRTKRTN